MGKLIKLRNEKKELEEKALMARFTLNNKAVKAQAEVPVPPLTNQLTNYRDFFVKNPYDYVVKTKSNNRDKQLLELVRYTFGIYTVSPNLMQVWDANFKTKILPLDFKKWYICLATGGSLYKEHAKAYLSKKEVHIFCTCPHLLTWEQLFIYSVAKAANPIEGIALRIAKSRINEKPFNDFWKTVIRFFSVHTPSTITEINDLLDYLEAKLHENRDYSISGQSLESLNKHMVNWHYQLRRMKVLGNSTWTGTYLPDETFTIEAAGKPTVTWNLHQILTAKELAAEGNRMRHCVLSYKDKCIKGNISIWSLTRQEGNGEAKAKLTIELDNQGNIKQARGLANRDARPEERHILHKWISKHNLSFSNSYY